MTTDHEFVADPNEPAYCKCGSHLQHHRLPASGSTPDECHRNCVRPEGHTGECRTFDPSPSSTESQPEQSKLSHPFEHLPHLTVQVDKETNDALVAVSRRRSNGYTGPDPTPEPEQGWCSSCDEIHEVSRPSCPTCGDWLVFAAEEETNPEQSKSPQFVEWFLTGINPKDGDFKMLEAWCKDAWNARQPEISALKLEIERLKRGGK